MRNCRRCGSQLKDGYPFLACEDCRKSLRKANGLGFGPVMEEEDRQEQAYQFYLTLPLKDLRKRQDLCRKQQEIAFKETQKGRNMDRAVENLSQMENALFRAVDKLAFG